MEKNTGLSFSGDIIYCICYKGTNYIKCAFSFRGNFLDYLNANYGVLCQLDIYISIIIKGISFNYTFFQYMELIEGRSF